MSTQLLDNVEGVHLLRFFGGADRGTCYQITKANSGVYVQLTGHQMEIVVEAYLLQKNEPSRE